MILHINALGKQDSEQHDLVFCDGHNNIIEDDTSLESDTAPGNEGVMAANSMARDPAAEEANISEDLNSATVINMLNYTKCGIQHTHNQIFAQNVLADNKMTTNAHNRMLNGRNAWSQDTTDGPPPPTTVMEQQNPATVQTAAPFPWVKLESNLQSTTQSQTEPPLTRPKEEPPPSSTPEQENDDNKEVDGKDCNNEEEDGGPILGTGQVNIDDLDEYHPESLTPGQQLAHGNRLPINTHSCTRAAAERSHLIHYAMA